MWRRHQVGVSASVSLRRDAEARRFGVSDACEDRTKVRAHPRIFRSRILLHLEQKAIRCSLDAPRDGHERCCAAS